MRFQWVVPIIVLAAGAQAAACDAQVSEVRTDHGSVSWELPIGEEVRPPVDGCALEALADRVAQFAAGGVTWWFRLRGISGGQAVRPWPSRAFHWWPVICKRRYCGALDGCACRSRLDCWAIRSPVPARGSWGGSCCGPTDAMIPDVPGPGRRTRRKKQRRRQDVEGVPHACVIVRRTARVCGVTDSLKRFPEESCSWT